MARQISFSFSQGDILRGPRFDQARNLALHLCDPVKHLRRPCFRSARGGLLFIQFNQLRDRFAKCRLLHRALVRQTRSFRFQRRQTRDQLGNPVRGIRVLGHQIRAQI